MALGVCERVCKNAKIDRKDAKIDAEKINNKNNC